MDFDCNVRISSVSHDVQDKGLVLLRQALLILSHGYDKSHPKLKELRHNITWAEMRGSMQGSFISPATMKVRETYAATLEKTSTAARSGVAIARSVIAGVKNSDLHNDIASGISGAAVNAKEKVGIAKDKLVNMKKKKKST
jgi:hypothetical protein